ncbi:MAG: hypothetical protein CSA13_00980 [Clostridiales bacterium]|nr:MAG: hypothetical protein CSA13_00980 [Clostridiales bacterium]
MKKEKIIKTVILIILPTLIIIRTSDIDILYTNLYYNIFIAFVYLYLCFTKIKNYLSEKKLISMGFERLTPILTLVFKWIPFFISNIIFVVYLYVIFTEGKTLNASIAIMHSYLYYALSVFTYLKESDVLLSDNCIRVNGMNIVNNIVNKVERIYTGGLWERYKIYLDNGDEFYMFVNKKGDEKFMNMFMGKMAR